MMHFSSLGKRRAVSNLPHQYQEGLLRLGMQNPFLKSKGIHLSQP